MEILKNQEECHHHKGSSPEYIVLDEDDNEIKLIDVVEQPPVKKLKIKDAEAPRVINFQQIEYLKSLPTLLPIAEINNIEKPKATDINVKEFFTEWKEKDLSELLLIDEYVYKDPLIKNMTPHESYVYTLGLNLVLENVTSSYKNSLTWLNNKQQQKKGSTVTEPILNLKLGVENEKEFLENLEDNSLKIQSLNKTLRKSNVLKYGCKICNFRSDCLHIVDQHLTNPHNLHSKGLVTYRDAFTTLKCNFCEDFKSYLKEEYVKHIRTVHRRLFVYIKPSCAYKCSFCEYECREKLRFFKHQQHCPYSNQEFLNSCQKPSRDDDLDYEFIFQNTKLFPNKYASFLLNNNRKLQFINNQTFQT